MTLTPDQAKLEVAETHKEFSECEAKAEADADKNADKNADKKDA